MSTTYRVGSVACVPRRRIASPAIAASRGCKPGVRSGRSGQLQHCVIPPRVFVSLSPLSRSFRGKDWCRGWIAEGDTCHPMRVHPMSLRRTQSGMKQSLWHPSRTDCSVHSASSPSGMRTTTSRLIDRAHLRLRHTTYARIESSENAHYAQKSVGSRNASNCIVDFPRGPSTIAFPLRDPRMSGTHPFLTLDLFAWWLFSLFHLRELHRSLPSIVLPCFIPSHIPSPAPPWPAAMSHHCIVLFSLLSHSIYLLLFGRISSSCLVFTCYFLWTYTHTFYSRADILPAPFSGPASGSDILPLCAATANGLTPKIDLRASENKSASDVTCRASSLRYHLLPGRQWPLCRMARVSSCVCWVGIREMEPGYPREVRRANERSEGRP